MDQRLHLDRSFLILILVAVTDISTTIILIIFIAIFSMIKVMFLDLFCEDLICDLGEEDEEELENVPGQRNVKC